MRRLAAVAGVLVGFALAAPPANARDAVVTSFDDTPIVAHFFPDVGASADQPAPTIMVGPGWSQPGETDPEGGSIANFIDAGYNVLTWDPRGFGGSGGTVQIDSPDYEGRDAQALVDYIAKQPEAELDSPGDPRLGMSGGSYGGGIQIILAALDSRVDAIAPTIAWNSFISSLFKADKIKLGWGLALSGLGVPFGVAPGIVSPAGPQLGHQSPEFYSTVTEGAATGTISESNRKWFADHGPDFLLDRIKVPTLIIQGTVDTLFTLEEAHRNFEALRKQGVPLKMMFFCGGHGVCLTDSDSDSPVVGGSALAEERRLQWFDRYLRDRANVDTGAEFEWIDEQATWHTSARYPPQATSEVSGTGAGTLPLTPGVSPPPGSGLALYGTPQDVSVKVEVPTTAGLDIVGEPKLELTYSGTAAPAQTHVFGQLVDPSRDIVVNNQVTPIPVTLDGAEHTLEIPLERIASLSTAEGYELQLISDSTVYDIQRSAGLVDFKSAKLTLPVTQPLAERSAECLKYPFGTGKDDRLVGSDGPDCLSGRSGRDRINAGGGNDELRGGRGRDHINAGPGDDVIRVARGSRDRVKCGAGDDTAYVNRKKDRWTGCETVKRRPVDKEPHRG